MLINYWSRWCPNFIIDKLFLLNKRWDSKNVHVELMNWIICWPSFVWHTAFQPPLPLCSTAHKYIQKKCLRNYNQHKSDESSPDFYLNPTKSKVTVLGGCFLLFLKTTSAHEKRKVALIGSFFFLSLKLFGAIHVQSS